MQTKNGYVVAAGKLGKGWFFREFHAQYEAAEQAMRAMIDVDALCVIPADVNFASNGNVRAWNSHAMSSLEY